MLPEAQAHLGADDSAGSRDGLLDMCRDGVEGRQAPMDGILLK